MVSFLFAWNIQLMAVEMNEVKKELEAIAWNIQQLSDKIGQIQNKVMVLDAEMSYILEQRDKSYEKIKMLRIQRDKGVRFFCLSVSFAYRSQRSNNILVFLVVRTLRFTTALLL